LEQRVEAEEEKAEIDAVEAGYSLNLGQDGDVEMYDDTRLLGGFEDNRHVLQTTHASSV
jgi:hypothetical protein